MGRIEELIIVFLIILLLFGAKRIPQLARSIGQSINEVKKGVAEGSPKDDDQDKKSS
ncbi:MAG TPA: twin-arginine translocase TatA/TatE family subunit [Candidatus Saccharimonadales bacterium]|nr:twin-arginine translocase TatA/TatE family subunit [Candidatus Saccharimonadales bacterium]